MSAQRAAEGPKGRGGLQQGSARPGNAPVLSASIKPRFNVLPHGPATARRRGDTPRGVTTGRGRTHARRGNVHFVFESGGYRRGRSARIAPYRVGTPTPWPAARADRIIQNGERAAHTSPRGRNFSRMIAPRKKRSVENKMRGWRGRSLRRSFFAACGPARASAVFGPR